ncbi:MAG TPA: sigma 54-interacting transcriptional regulator [Pyrinomonadaceae bacterium]|nr:sigma 54-interacting transcriptional regulator [Pyrinomonadaceae bacterium]
MRTSDSKHRDINTASKQMELFGSPVGPELPNHTSKTGLTGSNPLMLNLNEEISLLARSNHSVLITGESGTGKTTVAQIIHQRSLRASACLVDINCAALPDTLIESELFGYEKGAFTGAMIRKKGLFEVAEKGTLFLDEIGELKLELQAKLLKAIDQQNIRRLGGTKEIHCNVRIIAASSRNLQRMVRMGTFREDLYYRVAVFQLDIPPLRARQDDIRELVGRQLASERANAEFSEPLHIDERALSELSSYHWPGNIRQLQNVLARLAYYTNGQTISASHVRAELSRFKDLDANTIILPDSCSTLLQGEGLEDFSYRVRGNVIESVKNCMNGNITHAARRLKVNRSSLHEIIRKLSTRNQKLAATDNLLIFEREGDKSCTRATSDR